MRLRLLVRLDNPTLQLPRLEGRCVVAPQAPHADGSGSRPTGLLSPSPANPAGQTSPALLPRHSERRVPAGGVTRTPTVEKAKSNYRLESLSSPDRPASSYLWRADKSRAGGSMHCA